MKVSRILSAVLVALFPFTAMPAYATSEHEYAKGEYAIIREGLAPNKQMSLASHGDRYRIVDLRVGKFRGR